MCVYFPLGYRLNKYCGEHLVVVNEIQELEQEPDNVPHQRSLSNENDIERVPSGFREENNDGPIAEALIQNEQMFHHLKILKPSPSELENERRKSASTDENVDRPRKGVYSQVCNYLNEYNNFVYCEKLCTKLLQLMKVVNNFSHISRITSFGVIELDVLTKRTKMT